MNQCLVNIIEKSVLVTFTQVVEKGIIEVQSTNGRSILIYKKEIQNTNFETLSLKLDKGKYRFEILVDGQQITKILNIN